MKLLHIITTTLITALLFLFILPAPTTLATEGTDFAGQIEAPPGVELFQQEVESDGGDIGIILFFSRVLRISTIIAGIWILVNVIIAGYTYITGSGDAGSHEKVAGIITNSVIGIVLVISAYTIAALIGLLLFGDASYIINPEIQGITITV